MKGKSRGSVSGFHKSLSGRLRPERLEEILAEANADRKKKQEKEEKAKRDD